LARANRDKHRLLLAENMADIDPAFLRIVQLVLTCNLNYQIVQRLTQCKRDDSTFRPVKSENRACGVDSSRFQPDLETARAVPLQRVGLERARTHNAAVLAEGKTVSETQPTNFILGSMKWPQTRYEDAQ
jgi:hypothetical protein